MNLLVPAKAGMARELDDFGFLARHCERSEAIQGGLRTLWIAASLRSSQ
ncbi:MULTISPECIES: hypothetical protein [unclassified Sphingopyxis]|nr:hypothetical protein [Sphingopyxis sp. DBS4]HMN53504.1 hypothetical protein [Sphingopyxis sp.]